MGDRGSMAGYITQNSHIKSKIVIPFCTSGASEDIAASEPKTVSGAVFFAQKQEVGPAEHYSIYDRPSSLSDQTCHTIDAWTYSVVKTGKGGFI